MSLFDCRALGHGAFGEVYEGQVLGMNGENTVMQVAIKVRVARSAFESGFWFQLIDPVFHLSPSLRLFQKSAQSRTRWIS